MKKLAVLNSFAAWLIFSVALMLFPGPTQAYVYDHFTSVGINGSLWSDIGPDPNLFSQPGNGDTYLYFSSTTINQRDSLSSSKPVSGAFFVSMQYFNFNATNPAGPYHSSGVHLYLSDGTNMVDADRLKNNTNGNFFQGFSQIGGSQTYSDPIPSTVDKGWLGIGYNGKLGPDGRVTLWYNPDNPDNPGTPGTPGTGWTWLTACAPDFKQDPNFFIMGKIQDGTSLTFQVNQVQLTPLPPSVLLLGTGLLGLAGWRRFRKG